mgnify:CR=1 FL=1
MDFATLKQRLGRRRGFDGNDDRLGDFINDAYMAICGRRNTWAWLRRTHQFGTHTPEAVTASADGTPSATATSGAIFTNGSRTVTNLTSVATTQGTRTGAKIEAPDGTVNRILSHDATTNLYLEAPFGGTTSSAINPTGSGVGATYADSWKIYWDEYPLPEGAASIESIVCTGNGFVRHIRESSLLSPHMKGLTVKDYDSYPQYYALERHTQIPAPDNAPLVQGVVTFAAIDTGSVYIYKYCYFNTKTQEMGPLSAASAPHTTTVTNISMLVGTTGRPDYGTALYRTKAGGSEFYYLSSNGIAGGANYADTVRDTNLGFAASDTDFAGAAMATSIGAIAERGPVTSGSRHIRFWPPPDEEYLVDVTYFVAPRELTEDHDAPHIPRQHQPILLDLAESYALSEEENHSAAAQKRAYAMEAVERMEREEEADPGTRIQIGRGEPQIDEALGSWPRTITG